MPIEYRSLTHAALEQMRAIDRSEIIEAHYVMSDGCLQLVEEQWIHPGFTPETYAQRILRLQQLLANGGPIFGAFHAGTLVGIAAIENRFRGAATDQLRLDFLHVSRPFRGQGIGNHLFALSRHAARSMGARQLYITGSPSQHTVDFYLRMGCRVTTDIDPELFAEEPDDIHFECDV